jgi:NTE family protein
MTIQEPKRPQPMSRVKRNQKPVNIALQGGGAHGAFAWGVLDRVLEDERLTIEAISATSAGAMNAVVVAHGVQLGGSAGAREKLNEFWTEISRAGELYSPVRTLPWERWLQMYGIQADFSPTYHAFQLMTHLFSPYQLNPFNFNPLKDVLLKVIDFDTLPGSESATRVFLSATNVRTGKIKVFENRELSVDAVLASACLPYVFQAVEIDGEAYWDGGLGGNPPLVKLAQETAATDLLLVQVTPSRDSYVPITLAAIDRRLDQIAANAGLNAEVAAVEWARSHAAPSLRLFRIAAEDSIEGLAQRSSTDLGRGFIRLLHRSGREAAERWLGQSSAAAPAEAQRATSVTAEPALL